MKILRMMNLGVLILLGIAAGVAKIMQMPQEVRFFQDAGLGEVHLVLFGAAQVAGGILLVFQKMRKWGAIIMAITLGFSAVMIFMNGMVAFGFFSTLPILMAGVVIKESISKETAISG